MDMKKDITNRIHVKYNEKPCYDIVLTDSFKLLPNELKKFQIESKKICIVTETNVGPLYADKLIKVLKDYCKEVIIHTFSAGEKNKNLDTVNGIYQTLIEHHFDRSDMLLALGGGVVGDITGFVAATYLRGIDFIQVPTTLLSQVDSSIGGKTGVDFKSYKNMIGAFYMPKLVYMNLDTLNSLPVREYVSGMGEIIKHGLIKDSSYYLWLKEHKDDILRREANTLKEMLYVSCNIKRIVIENDPKEKGERALLNFGHTIGHAIEKQKDFSLLHGECVSIGICAAIYISNKLGEITSEEYRDIIDTLSSFQLPVQVSGISSKEVVDATKNDKKMEQGKIKFILIDYIGHAYIDKDVDDALLQEAVEAIINDFKK